MISDKNIVITIGNYGAVLVVHGIKTIKEKIFLEQLDDEAKDHIKEIFTKNKIVPVYILLDTIDQSYRKKNYPPLRKGDLAKLVKRDMENDNDKESIKNYFILNKGKIVTNQDKKRWECLFISSSNSDAINNWIDFLLTMPNHLVGIYMLPIETFSLFKAMKEKDKSEIEVTKKNRQQKNSPTSITCIVTQNKVSGMRQIVFSDTDFVFTRVVNYDFINQADSLEKYQQDLYSTFEYLRRLFGEESLSTFKVVNILSNEAISVLNTINNVDFNIVNYNPNSFAELIGYENVIPENSNFCDILISRIFSDKKKILKFLTPKITLVERFFIAIKAARFLNFAFSLVVCSMILFVVMSQNSIINKIEDAEFEKLQTTNKLVALKQAIISEDKIIEDGNELDIDTITEFGKIEETISNASQSIKDLYIDFSFLSENYFILDGFKYSIPNIDTKAPISKMVYEIIGSGKIKSSTGNLDDLIKHFSVFEKSLKQYAIERENKLTHSELPRDVNFTKKYYEFPINFTISGNKK